MPTMDLVELAASVDRLAFPARQRVLATTARSLAGSAELTTLLAQLDAGKGVQRRWALLLATIANHDGYLLSSLTSPDIESALIALRHCVARRSHLTAIIEHLPDAPTAWRHGLYQAVRAGAATDLAHRLLPVVRARFGEREVAQLLPACDRATTAELLPELDFAVSNWRALTRRHPQVVLEHLRGRLIAAGPADRSSVWHEFVGATTELAAHDPVAVLDLIVESGPSTGLPAGSARWLPMLARTDPERVAALLADPRRRIRFHPGRALVYALRPASDESLVALARSMFGDDVDLRELLHHLPPARRARVLTGALGRRDMVSAGLPIALLDLVPWRARHALARELLGTRPVADDPTFRLQVTARLPWQDAQPLLRAETTQPTATRRAAGYELLIGAAGATRDPDVVGALLASLTRLRNEQDPVRSAALRAITALPTWLFLAADPSTPATLATDALGARDASWATRRTIVDLAVQLIRQGATALRADMVEHGLRIMAISGDHAGNLALYGLHRELPRGAEHRVFDVLRPRIDADARVGRFGLVLALAAGLHRRAWTMPELQARVGAATTATDDAVVRNAIGLWLAAPATRDERVEIVFSRDRSTIVIDAVATAISTRRTDLLDRVFGRRLAGRFVPKNVRLVPILRGPASHWMPRQVGRYADLLTDLATAPGKAVWERVRAVTRLGRLPGIGAAAVRPFLADGEIAVCEAALAALAGTDRPDQVLGELLGYADTERARVAVFAAGRCAARVAPTALGAALRVVLAGRKVTSRKEAIRLLAEHRAPDAVAEFARLWADPGLHRDIRRAIVSTARLLLDDGRVWTFLTDAVAGDPAVAIGLTEAGPLTIAMRHRARYGALVRAVATSVDPDTARIGLAAWPAWCTWDTDGATRIAAIVGTLTNTATWRIAVTALVAACGRTGESAAVLEVVELLADADFSAPDRDVPAAQRLRALVAELVDQVELSAQSVRRVAAVLVPALTDRPEYRLDGLTLAVATLPTSGDPLPALRRIAALADRPVLAWQVTGQVAEWVDRHDPGRPELLAAARALAGEPVGALLAVGIAARAGEHAGWPAAWRDLVSLLRGSPDPDVRDRAFRTAMAPE